MKLELSGRSNMQQYIRELFTLGVAEQKEKRYSLPPPSCLHALSLIKLKYLPFVFTSAC